jgi:7,8-dihydropterin-6-yl-methyl-4-(beta-D-ribofuranosyl)aminobenzene 5'-phosphate synthase
MKAKVLSVYDEGSLERTSLIGARGISILIEADGERTLFDTGMRGNYLMHNMDALGIDADTIDRVVISHMHRPHTGGLAAFLERRKGTIDVIVPSPMDMRRTFLGITMGKAGLPPEASAKARISTVDEWMRLSDHLSVTGTVPAIGAPADAQIEENALVLMTKNGPVLICGCCHRGITDMMAYVRETTGRKVTAVIGGIHTTGMKRNNVHEIAGTLKENGPPALYLSHCTGQTQRTYLREKLGLTAVKEFYAGTEIQFEI